MGRFLCWLGFHKWGKWQEESRHWMNKNRSFEQEVIEYQRYCIRCGAPFVLKEDKP